MSRLLAFALVGLLGVESIRAIELAELVFWSDEARTNKIWEYTPGYPLSSDVVIPEVFYVDAQLRSNGQGAKTVKPKQVALLFERSTKSGPIGTHPSVQVALWTSSKASAVYQGRVALSSKKHVDPEGGVYYLGLLAAGAGSEDALRLYLGHIHIPKSSSRNSTEVGEAHTKYIPELSEFHELPAIYHKFAEPEPRASPVTSSVFALLAVILPISLFVFGVFRLDMNVKGLMNASSCAFAIGIAAFLAILAMFFRSWNLVETSAAAIALSLVMVLVGNRVLCEIRAHGHLGL